MQEDITLQRFLHFKEMFISSNIPNSELLELIESYLNADDEPAVEEIPVLDGQLSLYEMAS